MAKNTNRKGRRKTGRFIGLLVSILNSPHFKNLTGNEIKVFIHLYTSYNGSNNGNLAIPYNKAEEYGLSRQTLSRVLKSLEKKGWIKTSRQGGKGILSLYAVTTEAINEVYSNGLLVHNLKPTTQASHDWKHFKPF